MPDNDHPRMNRDHLFFGDWRLAHCPSESGGSRFSAGYSGGIEPVRLSSGHTAGMAGVACHF
jgi:hypothetical protein